MVAGFRKAGLASALLVLVCGAAVVHAGDVSDIIFSIEAINDAGTGYLEFDSSELVPGPSGSFVWNTGLHEIPDMFGDPIAILDQATMTLVPDPNPNMPYRINVGFALHAGMTTTRFIIKTAQISFPTIAEAYLVEPDGGGRATASLGVTDVDGDGVTLVGFGEIGIGAYRAQYNGFVPDGTTFASLVNEVTAGPGGSGSGSQTMPVGSGYATIPTDVSDMSAIFDFTLTPNDSASSTTTYRILPEPSSALGLLVLAGVALARRR